MGVQASGKICTKCKANQPFSFYYIRTDTGNYCSHCSECRSKRHKERYLNDIAYKTRLRKNSEEWQATNSVRARFIKNRAMAINKKRRKPIEFTLSFEQIQELWNRGCEYCNRSIVDECGVGLDRLDNDKGYTIDNVVPCCGKCNKVRNTILTYEEMKVAMNAVMAFRESNK